MSPRWNLLALVTWLVSFTAGKQVINNTCKEFIEETRLPCLLCQVVASLMVVTFQPSSIHVFVQTLTYLLYVVSSRSSALHVGAAILLSCSPVIQSTSLLLPVYLPPWALTWFLWFPSPCENSSSASLQSPVILFFSAHPPTLSPPSVPFPVSASSSFPALRSLGQ